MHGRDIVTLTSIVNSINSNMYYYTRNVSLSFFKIGEKVGILSNFLQNFFINFNNFLFFSKNKDSILLKQCIHINIIIIYSSERLDYYIVSITI